MPKIDENCPKIDFKQSLDDIISEISNLNLKY